jgi:predicted ABC-type ATPase
MAGGPASGKTSALRASPELEPDAGVIINPDDIKEALPEYGQMVAGKEKYAASGTHEESSDLGKRLQADAMDLGLNVVVDGTGDSKPGKFTGKMEAMDAAGYEVSALYVTIPTDEAVIRATKRAVKSGRWVPEPEIRSQHKNVSNNFEAVAALPFIKDIKLYDNSGEGDPELIGEGSAGNFGAILDDKLEEFIGKKNEPDYVPEEIKEAKVADEDHGPFTHKPASDEVATEDWIQHPVSDSADYLDGEPPSYEGEGDADSTSDGDQG